MEVSDDGCGIPKESRPLIAMPHTTSKIRHFEDIYNQNLSTLGFRGEALFCLANISSKLIIATRCPGEPLAEKLEFRHDGTLDPASVTAIPKKQGTTVAVVRLMESLPVRRQDMERRILEQRNKLVKMMEGYAVFSVGVRINLIDIVGTSCKENIILSTPGNSTSIQETVSSVFGPNFLSNTCPISIDLTTIVGTIDKTAKPTVETRESNHPILWKMEGLICKAQSLKQRGERNRQIFSINGRPVDLPKISRIINDVWRSFGGNKRPCCVFQFTLPNHAYDINLSPDKRQVVFTNEKEVHDAVLRSVTELWASQTEGQFVRSQIEATTASSLDVDSAIEDSDVDEVQHDIESPSQYTRRFAFSHNLAHARMQHEFDDGRRRSGETEEHYLNRRHQAQNSEAERDGKDNINLPGQELQENLSEETSTVTPSPTSTSSSSHLTMECNEPIEECTRPVDVSSKSNIENLKRSIEEPSEAEKRVWREAKRRFNEKNAEIENELYKIDQNRVRATKCTDPISNNEKGTFERNPEQGPQKKSGSQTLQQFGFRVVSETTRKDTATQRGSILTSAIADSQQSVNDGNLNSSSAENAQSDDLRQQTQETLPNNDHNEPTTIVWESMGGTDEIIHAARKERLEMRDRRRHIREKGKSTIPVDSDQFEDNVERDPNSTNQITLRNDDFKSMAVIGQFNLGFILARTQDNHLWILDQHACDEKFNYEKLVRDTVIHEQQLLAPIPLDLSPSEEACILDNMETFEKNGFRFKYSPDQQPRHRLALTALPHSGASDGRKAVQFGKDDVLALCAILSSEESSSAYESASGGGTGTDGSGMYGNNAVRRYVKRSSGDSADKLIARLPKAIAMFASRACRGSIMIGKALSQKEMERVVTRLADVEQPWNCPHGRPTLRHVGDMQDLIEEDEVVAAEYVAGPTISFMSQESPIQDE